MSKYVVWIETLDQKTWKINRDLKPAGYVIASGKGEAQKEARKKFKLGNAQQAYLLLDPATVNRMIEEEEREARKTFYDAYRTEQKNYEKLPR